MTIHSQCFHPGFTGVSRVRLDIDRRLRTAVRHADRRDFAASAARISWSTTIQSATRRRWQPTSDQEAADRYLVVLQEPNGNELCLT